MLGMHANGLWIYKFLILSMAGKAEIIIVIGFNQLGSTRTSVRVMAVEASDLGLEVSTLLEVDPLLMMRFRMRLRISP